MKFDVFITRNIYSEVFQELSAVFIYHFAMLSFAILKAGKAQTSHSLTQSHIAETL